MEPRRSTLITRKDIRDRFSQNLEWATGIDLATAWTTPNKSLCALHRRSRRDPPLQVRAVVGPLDGTTDPGALRALHCMGKLRMRVGKRRFHPKVYIFRGIAKSVAWIGSANFTSSGFGENEEVVFETSDTKAVEGWFKCLWEEPCPLLDESTINRYAKWRKSLRRQSPRKIWTPATSDVTTVHRTQLLEKVNDWKSYVAALEKCDFWWRLENHRDMYPFSVLGEVSSYLHTISTGQEIVRRTNWGNLERRECYILRGFEREEEEGRWGLLGSLERTGAAYVFNPANKGVMPVRRKIREQVDRVLNADPDEIAEVAHDAMGTITKLKYAENKDRSIGPAAATRLLTLARPDRLVSVNRASAVGLGELLGSRSRSGRTLKTPGSLADNYENLLNWVSDQPWFKTPQPDDPMEREIWKYRAALLDAFVYERGT